MYRIGDFSRLTELSVRVLRHYHEIGLLVPASIDERSGYRSYAVEQLAVAHQITALKQLGLSLAQIGTVVRDEPTDDHIAGMLALEHARTEQALDELQRKLRDLDREIAALRDRGSLRDLPVVVRSTPALPYLSVRRQVRDLAAVERLVEQIAVVRDRTVPNDTIAVVGHDEMFDTENIDVEVGLVTPTTEPVPIGEGVVLQPRELEPVAQAATVVARGFGEHEHRRAMTALAIWLADHDHHLAGPGREVIHPATSTEPIVELQFPVTPTG